MIALNVLEASYHLRFSGSLALTTFKLRWLLDQVALELDVHAHHPALNEMLQRLFDNRLTGLVDRWVPGLQGSLWFHRASPSDLDLLLRPGVTGIWSIKRVLPSAAGLTHLPWLYPTDEEQPAQSHGNLQAVIDFTRFTD